MGALVSLPGLKMVARLGVAAIRERSLALTQRVIARAKEANLGVASPESPARRGAITSLSFPGDANVHKRLLAQDMVSSYRGYLRVAPHFYSTEEEIDAFMDALVSFAREESK